ncbi:phage tail protein [Jeotgalibaca porci]|uniref:phage tail protein n=1 Tax=Jeotgalibaca porci TaxID=1868793 RepID=UPI0035A07109
MATEIAQAYVQILPSARGFSDAIKGEIDPGAEAAGKSAGSKIGTGIKLAAAAAVAAAGVALGKVISSSLAEGANLQQSIGGIETLFKGSADKVIDYANIAYKTAGLSANDYMESVTGFSASLLQSMGGDTAKAAETANMALIDMSDNANKMGSSMESIQNAYQGFAKQNYTMLDNLKLGYGGTKTEMERLLADATKLTGVKYDINNLADVYDAIHAVQEELGITGTTAKESAETFSGSLASMKASFSNVLGGLSLGQDIQPALNALADTTATFFFGNFIPMVKNILQALPGAIVTFFQAAAPQFIAGGKALLESLGVGIGEGTSGMLAKVQGVVQPILNSFKTAFGQLPALFQTVVGAVTPIIGSIATAFTKLDFSGLAAVISKIIPAVTNGFSVMMAIVSPAIDTVINSVVNLWNTLQPLLSILADALMPVFQVVGAFLGGVFKGVLLGLSATFDTVTTVISYLTPVVAWLVDAFKACVPALTKVAEWVGLVIGYFGNLGGAGTSLKSLLTSAWTNIKSMISIAGAGIGSVINVIKSIFSSLGSSGGVLKNILSVAWNGIKSAISLVGSGISAIISGIKSVFSGLGSSGGILRNTLSGAWNGIKSVISAVGNGIKSVINAIKSVFSSLGSAGNSVRSAISSAFNGMRSVVSSVAGSISGIIGNIKNVFSSLKNINISGAGSAIMNGFLGGLKSAYEGVKNFVGGIAGWIKNNKGPIEYDRKLLIPAGNAIMEGFDYALIDKFKDVQKTVGGMTGALFDAVSVNTPTLEATSNVVSGMTVNQARSQELSSNNNDVLQLLRELKNLTIVLDDGTVVGKLGPQFNQYFGNEATLDRRYGR